MIRPDSAALRYIAPQQIAELERTGAFGLEEYLRAVEFGYLHWGAGRGSLVARQSLWVAGEQEEGSGRYFGQKGSIGSLKLLGGAIPDVGIVGAVLYAAGFELTGVDVSVLLYRTPGGALRAHVRGDSGFTGRKTGAVAAVAVKHLMRRNFSKAISVGLVGAGNIAFRIGEALARSLPVGHIAVSSRDHEHAAACARRLRALTPADAISVRDAVEGSDVIVLATTSRTPVIDGAWLRAGALVLAMGAHYPEAREVDDATVARARIVVDSRDQALAEKGDLLIPLRDGVIRPSDVARELGDVIAERPSAVSDGKDITLFCSGGVAFEYLAVADAIVTTIERSEGIQPDMQWERWRG